MNKQIIERTMKVMKLPIHQAVAIYEDDETPCCVGARLAGFFGHIYYTEGMEIFAKKLGGNRAQILLMLKEAGAGNQPLSDRNWPTSPYEVWENLMQIEEFPDLRGAILNEMNLEGADLSNSDLSGASLRRTNLEESFLCNIKLRGADLRGADLYKADLRGADLREADLREANLQSAYLRRIDLRGADLRGAEFYIDQFSEQTLLEGALGIDE